MPMGGGSSPLMALVRLLSGIDETMMEIGKQRQHFLVLVGKICTQELSPKRPSHEVISVPAKLSHMLAYDHPPGELLAFAWHAGHGVQDD
jgi:hypothetical protein